VPNDVDAQVFDKKYYEEVSLLSSTCSCPHYLSNIVYVVYTDSCSVEPGAREELVLKTKTGLLEVLKTK
jgi:hypothetical protein